MNKEQILQLEAGIELDDAVHRKVMGRKEPSLMHPLPKYSADISAAWQVVKKVMSEGYSYFSNYGDNKKWGVTYAHSIGALVWADTIEEAICKAALLTKLEVKSGN